MNYFESNLTGSLEQDCGWYLPRQHHLSAVCSYLSIRLASFLPSTQSTPPTPPPPPPPPPPPSSAQPLQTSTHKTNTTAETKRCATAASLPLFLSPTMPTPSAPGPQSPYTFSSTCPETDDTHDAHDTHMDLADDSIHDSAAIEDHSTSTLADASPRPRFDTSDGPVRDSETDSSSPIAHERPCLDSHKNPDALDIDRTDSPCDPSPLEPVQTSRPRQGVGTSHMPTYQMHTTATPKSQYPHPEYAAADHDYALPSMGYGFPSRRVCSPPNTTQQGPARLDTLCARSKPAWARR